MNAKFINPVLQSMVNTLSTMAQLNPTPGKPSLKNDNKPLGAVTGVISILDINKRMLHVEKTEIDPLVEDLTGELANIVIGGAKKIFEDQGYKFGLTLPSVASGPEHTVDHPYDGPKIVLPFTVETGEFFVEICFQE